MSFCTKATATSPRAISWMLATEAPEVCAVACTPGTFADQTSGASVANIQLIARGDVAVAFVQNDIAYYGFHGIEMFMDRVANKPQLVSNLRGMAMLYPEIIQVATLKGKGITSIADLKDRRVAVGAPGSGTEVNARQILRLFGLGYYNIREDFLNFAEAADQLKDGVIDAAFITAGIPTPPIPDVAPSRGRPLYDDLRPAYTRLDPLVALLRRRGFTGLMSAAGRPGEGVVWFDHGRLHSGWLLLPEARDVVIQRDDPLAALRALWADADAIIAVHPGPPPLPAHAIAAAAPARATGPPPAAAPAPPASAPPPPPPPARPAAPAPRATPPPDGRGSVAVSGPAGRARGALPARPAAEITTAGAALAAVPWDRLLPHAPARGRRRP